MSVIGSWAEDADAFLDFISVDGGEAILQMSMLADASDEALLVTRLFDDEMSDAATTENDLEEFQQRVSALFGGGQQGVSRCGALRSGPWSSCKLALTLSRNGALSVAV